MRLPMIAATSLLLLTTLPASAQSSREPYRALGTEPFWSLTIDGNRIRYQPASGRTVTAAKPRPIVGFNGERYVTRGMTVDITHVECSDGMSDRTYHDTVRLTVNGRTLKGCGGAVQAERPATASLIEGEWTIQAISGHPPVAQSNPRVTFANTRMSGSTGCNNFNGGFRFERGRLTAGPLATTRRACIGPVNAQEQTLLKLFDQPLNVSRSRDGKLVMTARGGETIVLAPAGQR